MKKLIASAAIAGNLFTSGSAVQSQEQVVIPSVFGAPVSSDERNILVADFLELKNFGCKRE